MSHPSNQVAFVFIVDLDDEPDTMATVMDEDLDSQHGILAAETV